MLLIVIALLGIGALSGLGTLITRLQSGADPATALNIISSAPPDLEKRLVWLADRPASDQQREMEPNTREQLTAAYLRAWTQWNIALEVGQPVGLNSYFAGPALAGVTNNVTTTVAAGWNLHQSNLHHELELHFYADDGTLVAFTDQNLQLVQHFRRATADAATENTGEDTVEDTFVVESSHRYAVVMLRQDDNWRIYQWRREGNAAATTTASWIDPAAPLPTRLPALAAALPGLRNGQLWVDGAPFAVAGINYYPQATPWTRFWPAYNGTQIDRDLALVQSLGLNTVRIFISYADFGGPQVDPIMRAQLTDFLKRAQNANLKVIVTLFDHHTDHHPATWAADARHLANLIPPFANNPTILAWDIKNEPDRDYAANTPALVDGWLRFVARHVRWHDPNHLITIGWSNPEAAATLPALVDFVSFHYFDEPTTYNTRVQALQSKVGTQPILLQEFTYSTWNSPFFPGHSEQEQAAYYAALLRQHRPLQTLGYLVWTLHDFDTVPLAEFRYPWQRAAQAHMGVIRGNGSFKPAASLLHPTADLNYPPLTLAQRWLKPFWMIFAGGWLALSIIVAYATYRRRQRTP